MLLKLTLTFILALVSMYWAGEMARQNPTIDAFVGELERGYGAFNERLKNTTVSTVSGYALGLRAFFGWLAICAGAGLFMLDHAFWADYLAGPPVPFSLVLVLGTLSWFWILGMLGWLSVWWFAAHSKPRELLPLLAAVGIVVLTPSIMGLLEYARDAMGMPWESVHNRPSAVFLEQLRRTPLLFGRHLLESNNPILLGALLSLSFGMVLAAFYLFGWVLSAPTAFTAAILVAVPVLLARFISTIAPRKPFFGFTALIFTGVSMYLASI